MSDVQWSTKCFHSLSWKGQPVLFFWFWKTWKQASFHIILPGLFQDFFCFCFFFLRKKLVTCETQEAPLVELPLSRFLSRKNMWNQGAPCLISILPTRYFSTCSLFPVTWYLGMHFAKKNWDREPSWWGKKHEADFRLWRVFYLLQSAWCAFFSPYSNEFETAG